jgi:hypothetical protein
MKNNLFSIKERDVVNAVLYFLRAKDIFCRRLNVGGMISHRDGKYIQNPNTPRGMADIIVVWEGHAIWIECKKPAGGRQSENQKIFEKEAIKSGATYVIVTSVDELVDKLGFIFEKE